MTAPDPARHYMVRPGAPFTRSPGPARVGGLQHPGVRRAARLLLRAAVAQQLRLPRRTPGRHQRVRTPPSLAPDPRRPHPISHQDRSGHSHDRAPHRRPGPHLRPSRYCAKVSPITATTALFTTVTGTPCTGSSARSTRPRDHASKHFRSPATPRRRRVRVRQRPLLHDRRTRLVLRRGHRAGLGSLPDRPRLTAGRLTRCSAWVSLACGQQARGGPQRTFLLTWRRVSSIGSARFGRVHA
jgi:hypothetical protein